MKSKNIKKTVPAKKAPLKQVLQKNEKIKETVTKAATKLSTVNKVLKKKKAPAQVKKEALVENEDAEKKVAKAAKDLKLVNIKLAAEMAERTIIESELATTKTDLAEAHDDLSKAQVKVEEAEQNALQDAHTGLPNRVSFEQSLNQGLIQAQRRLGARRPIY